MIIAHLNEQHKKDPEIGRQQIWGFWQCCDPTVLQVP